MAEEVGVGYVRLVPSMRGFGRALTRQLRAELAGVGGKLGEQVGKETGDSAGDEVDKSLKSRFMRLGRELPKVLGRSLVASVKPLAATAGVAFGAQFALSLASSLATAGKLVGQAGIAGVLLAPSAALAAAAALGTYKLALSGVGDALRAGLSGDTEAFNEALARLSPSARQVVGEIAGMKKGFDGLRAAVQERFFDPLVGQVKPLGSLYLPRVQKVLGDIARTAGQSGNQVLSFFGSPGVARQLGAALQNAGKATENVVKSLAFLPQALLPIVTVGSTFLPRLTNGLGTATSRFAAFMEQAERSGRLRGWIQGGIDAVHRLVDAGKQVGRIFGDVGSIFSTIFKASGLTGGGGILDSIENLTSKASEFFKTSAGADAMRAAFDGIRLALTLIKGVIGNSFGLLAKVLKPLLPKIGKFVSALARLADAVIDVGLDALEPPLTAVGKVLGFVLPKLTSLADFLARNKPILQGIGIAILTFMVPAFAAWAISAGIAAISTLLAIAPLLLLGIAIAGLAALVIIHFDTIKRWIGNVFNWVKDNWPLLLAILTGPFGLAVLLISRNWDKIKAGATAVKDWIGDRIGDIVGFVKGLPRRITDAAAGMWDGITGAFKSAINGIIRLWNGLEFPSVTVGGQDPLGSFGPSLPRVTIGGWDLPNIPQFHGGGTFRTTSPGGEGLAKLKDGEHIFTPRQLAAVRSAPAPARPASVDINLMGGEGLFFRWLRERIMEAAGGNVQRAFGTGTA